MMKFSLKINIVLIVRDWNQDPYKTKCLKRNGKTNTNKRRSHAFKKYSYKMWTDGRINKNFDGVNEGDMRPASE
jgi:hypothetical protein